MRRYDENQPVLDFRKWPVLTSLEGRHPGFCKIGWMPAGAGMAKTSQLWIFVNGQLLSPRRSASWILQDCLDTGMRRYDENQPVLDFRKWPVLTPSKVGIRGFAGLSGYRHAPV
jgi:hypothetical protein